jgi:crossover junction endodeoxyribonuclease RuvC
MLILGIDPGAHGALALLDASKAVPNLLMVRDMPTTQVKRGQREVNEVNAPMLAAMVRDFQKLGQIEAGFVEQVGAMPGQGVSSMFAFGRAFGVLEGVLAGCGVPCTRVPPQTWQRAMRVRGGKDGSRERAAAVYPRDAHLFARKKDDGRSDATLIASYGAQLFAAL